jgi:hypothetical protein
VDDSLRHQRDVSLGQLEALIRRGRQLREARSVDATRAWQRDCAAAVNQLSGGSKAHWLARAYSGAFLLRSANGGAVLEADTTEIIDRILTVLAEGAASLARMDDVAASSTESPRPRKFEFVHNPELRPVLEQTFDDSREALDRNNYGLALVLSCSVIEALLTDALEHARSQALDVPEGAIAEWSFDERIAAAERARLIRGGCARLSPVARAYRTLTDTEGHLHPHAQVSERDAKIAGQVLRVVMRDLDPGR